MKSKKAQTSITATNLIILFIFLIGTISLYFLLKNLTPEDEKELIINYSELSEEYNLENIIYKAVDYQGNEIIGKSYYGVDGTYTKEKPLIQGEHHYTYWVKNDSYYIEPKELVIDETHRNQTIIAKAYKKVNLSEDIRIIDHNNYPTYNEISFIEKKDGLFDIAEFEIIYNSKERTRFPFGAVIIFEYDKQIDDLKCANTFRTYFPNFYSMGSRENRRGAFEIEEDEGDWKTLEINCFVEKYYEKILTNNIIKISIYPNDFFLGDWNFKEEYELLLGVEDYLMNPLNKPIYEGEITIKSNKR